MSDKLTSRQRDKRAWLESCGYICGERDPLINTAFKGRYMVADAECVKPCRDADEAGHFAIVGNSLAALIDEAYSAISGN